MFLADLTGQVMLRTPDDPRPQAGMTRAEAMPVAAVALAELLAGRPGNEVAPPPPR